MKKLLCLLPFIILISCNRQKSTASKTHLPATTKPAAKQYDPANDKQYAPQQLEAFLDSVGHLPTKPLADKVAFYADSVFKSQRQMDTVISPADMAILKHAIRKGVMAVKTARRIFNNKAIDTSCTEKSIFLNYKPGLTPVVFYSFDKRKTDYNEYAICIGDPGHCPNAALYFFKANKVIALHNGYNRFNDEQGHYKDADGKTVVYSVEMFDEGSGIWWFNYFFYKYDGNKLIPVLNELQNGNVQGSLGTRVLWLESTIQKTNPLTIKMVYYSQFAIPDSNTGEYGPLIINDSTTVQYLWDERTKTLQGQYTKSKISKAQILSYYLEDNDYMFMNSYYSTLKAALRDTGKRKLTLEYLNKVKNIYCGQQ